MVFTDEEWFDAPWRTPAQTRDLLLELEPNLTTERIQKLRSLCINAETMRKQDTQQFVMCPHCKGWHGQLSNVDALCEKHEAQLAPLRFDSKTKTKDNHELH